MHITTKAIVLSSIRYKDADLIVRCYTEKFGVKSYLLKSVLKSKKGKIKAGYFQPLSILDIEANHNDNRDLQYIKEVKLGYNLSTLQTNIVKSTIAIFLSEILTNILREEEENIKLFEFLKTSIIWSDENQPYPLFHHVFLLELTKYLGFYPDLSKKEKLYFDLLEGEFKDTKSGNYTVFGENLTLLKQLLGIKFDVNKTPKMNSTQKQEILNMILLYFELHLDGFKKPRSLVVLNQVFS